MLSEGVKEGDGGDDDEGVDDEVDDDGMALGAEWFGLVFGLTAILVEDRRRLLQHTAFPSDAKLDKEVGRE